jgi:membrane protein
MSSKPDAYGRDATSPLSVPLKGWRQVVERTWTESGRHNLSVIAAGCAFYALFAIFPALAALVTLFGLTTNPTTSIDAQFEVLGLVLPPAAFDMVVEQTQRIVAASNHTLGLSLVISIGLALWSLTFLTQAVFSALNVAYEEPERRSVLRFYLSTFLFAVAGVFGGSVTLLAVVYVPIAFAYAGYTTDFTHFISVARWPLLAFIVLVLLCSLYRYGPCRNDAKWRWVAPGAVLATAVWLAASAGFSYYVSNFANYDKIYGSLGAVIVLLFWLYITFYILLLGAEINAELELQTEVDTTVGPAKPMGSRGAFVADHVAGGPHNRKRPAGPVTADPSAAKPGLATPRPRRTAKKSGKGG